MADLRERPDVETIIRFRSKMGELWANAHNEFRDNDAYYNRKFNVWSANYQGRPVFYDSTPTHLVNHAVDTLMSFSPRIHREPVGDTEEHKQDATNLEHGLKAVMEDAALHETTLPWKVAAQYLVAHGYAVVEAPILVGLGERPEEPNMDDYETQEEYDGAMSIYRANRRSFNPVRIRVPHPSTVLINPNEKIPTMAIKASKMTAQDLHEQSVTKKRKQRRKYSEIFDMGNYDPWDEVETWDYWTPHWHVKLLANASAHYGSPSSRAATPIWMERNTMGFVPFVHAFAGWGMDIAETGGDPANLAQGILTPNKETIRKRTQELSAFHQILLRFAFAPMGTSRDPMTLAQAIANEGILEGDPQDFWVMNTPDVPGWALQLRGQTDNTLEMGTYSSALAGVRQAGVTTVGQQAILNTAGLRTFAAPALQREHMASIVGSRILQLVDSVSELSGGIGANGKTLRKSQIHNVYGVQIAFPHSEPVMELQNRQMAMSEYGAGLIDPMTYYETAGYENGTEIKQRLIEESVRNLPSVREKIETLVAQQMGLVDEDNQDQAAQEIAQRQQAMAPQVPGVNGAGGGADLNRALTPDTFQPERIDIGR
jgi:hypothetical protein